VIKVENFINGLIFYALMVNKYQRAYEIIAKADGIDERVLEFIDRFIKLDELTQPKMFIKRYEGGTDRGPSDNTFWISCAAVVDETFDQLEEFLKRKFPEYPITTIDMSSSKRIFVKDNSKEVRLILHSPSLDKIVEDYTSHGVGTYDAFINATYATRNYARLKIYKGGVNPEPFNPM
jgi:hypothetical protein